MKKILTNLLKLFLIIFVLISTSAQSDVLIKNKCTAEKCITCEIPAQNKNNRSCKKCLNSVLYKEEDYLFGCKEMLTAKNCASAQLEVDKEVCSICLPGFYFGVQASKECLKIEGSNNCLSGEQDFEKKTFTCLGCEKGFFLDKNSCVEIPKDKIINKCLVHKKIDEDFTCLTCEFDFYEDKGKCVEDKVKTMCIGDTYKRIANLDTCESCATVRGFFAVNIQTEGDKAYQVCMKGKGSNPITDPEILTQKKIILLACCCVGGLLVIGLIIWLIVKSKKKENDDLYDSMISNGPI